MRKYIILGALFLAIASPLVLAFLYRNKNVSPQHVTLNYWIVEGDPTDYTTIVNAYRAVHPYVTINFTTVKLEEYENDLIQAWARGEGPDIFSLPNSWVKKYQDLILPLPAQTNVAFYQYKKVLFHTSTSIKYIPQTSITLNDLNNYVDVVKKDVVLPDANGQNRIYALPYSVDTLALYYNEDLLNTAHITVPAKSWQELVGQCSKLTLLDQQNNILQACIALGLTDNIKNYFEILSLIMMQNGSPMVTAAGNHTAFGTDAEADLGTRALDFYTSFANINKETFTWDKKQPESLDNFLAGKSAYYLGLLSDDKTISGQAGLNWSVSDMLHINADGTDRVLNRAGNPTQINYASYWVETVARSSKTPQEAWDFIQVIAREKRNRDYVAATGKISPLKIVLQDQVKNPDLAVWVNQALTATDWYHGHDATAAKNDFKEMTDAVSLDNQTSATAMDLAAKKIDLTLK